MKFAGILCLTFNILLNLNEVYTKRCQCNSVIKFSNETLNMIESSVVVYDNNKIVKKNKDEITFKITDGNIKGIARRIDVEYDMELSGFAIEKLSDDNGDQLAIRGMVCKATKRIVTDKNTSKGYDCLKDNYWIIFPLESQNIQENEENFNIIWSTSNAKVYDYINDNTTLITIPARTEDNDLKVDEKNYQTVFASKKFSLEIPKSKFYSYCIHAFELTFNNAGENIKKIIKNNDSTLEEIHKSTLETVENKLLTMLCEKNLRDEDSASDSNPKTTAVDVQEKNGFKSILSLVLCFQAILSSILIFF
ncbi:hypothetical protein SLOPH_1087 [Spraguea lophii 42_110]|uniref:Uncharacterized protein n=1 Tax=Spraguea lophii (strain 42_110) TaxID=1358809 RepID=S7W701_SPRLO|nr:hypothetical protein SLOPH_1087 [Spraguea lophii 42_110]